MRARLPRARPRRRNGPLTVVGVLIVVGCALAFAVGWLQAGNRQPVVALHARSPLGTYSPRLTCRWCGSARPGR